MSIYTYNFISSISEALNLNYEEIEELSDQMLYQIVKTTPSNQVNPPQLEYIKKMNNDERKQMTISANNKKRGYKESEFSRKLKSISQKERWSKTTKEQRIEHGKKSRDGISEEKRKSQTENALKAFSPARQKGIKQPLTECPHCGKIGGNPIMRRYHFDNCKGKNEYILCRS